MILKVLLVVVATVSYAVSDDAAQNFAAANRNFTADIYKILSKENSGNLIFSPLSLQIILALLTEGAVCNTKTQLETALHLKCEKETERGVSQLNLNVSEKDLKLLSAIRVYIGEKFVLKERFKNVAVQYYKAGVQKVDFCSGANAAKIINDWVAQNTNNKIQNLIPSNILNCLTRVVLVNALYFSGQWVTPFKPSETRKEMFYTTCDSGEYVDMMHSSPSSSAVYEYFYSIQLKAKFLVLPYRNSKVAITLILPDEVDGLRHLESNIKECLKPQNMTRNRVLISLPKFKITSTINFKPILQKLGITDVFSETNANLSDISNEHGLYVSDVYHKAFIDVNENGTEAAAATAVVVGVTSVGTGRQERFEANHPFLFIIRDKERDVTLFIGKATKL